MILLPLLALLAAPPKTFLGLPEAPARYTTVQGIKVHYLAYGQGPMALVFVHGWCCDLSFWAQQVGAFEGKAPVVLIDLPGHGGSDKPEVPYGADLFADALNAVLEAQGITKAVLVGHSMGTPAIRQFYRRHPEKTLALVAVDGSLRAVGTPEVLKNLAGRFRGEKSKEAIGATVDSMFGPPASPELRAEVKGVMTSAPPHVATSAMELMGDPALWTPDPIRVPLLVVLARSPFWADDYEAFVRTLAPQVDFHVLDGVDHFLMLERPDLFNALLEGFLEKNRLLGLKARTP
jgi:pimeloyl-ACP methyl ester carboxylesterase